MPCSALNNSNRPCGISTQKKYCHVHVRKMLKDEKNKKLAYKVKQQSFELNRLNESNVALRKKILDLEIQQKEMESQHMKMEMKISDLTDENDMLSSMKDDFESYQTIKSYERLFAKMSTIYGKETAREIYRAMKEDPSKCFDDLGYRPWARFNRLRLERNAAAHVLD